MINKETILSVYTEKQTLLEYLTAIEKALNKAVLVSADIVDEGSNKCHFVFTFEDDTKVITPTIEFIKPVKGATIRNGVLYLTLADGTEVSAGSITASFGATTFNGDVLIHANAKVDGNLQVNGVIEQNSWKFDAPIVIESNLPSGVSCYYGRARASNGKLNIVIALCANNTNIASSAVTSVVSLAIPKEIGAKLYAFAGQTIDSKVVSFHANDDADFLDYGDAKVKIDKMSDTSLNIRIFIKNTTTASKVCNCRAEFNFILS